MSEDDEEERSEGDDDASGEDEVGEDDDIEGLDEPGFSQVTYGMVVFGRAFETGGSFSWSKAHAIARLLASQPELEGCELVGMPGGDCSVETGAGQTPDETIYSGFVVGAVVASAEADPDLQGTESEATTFTDADIERARRAWETNRETASSSHVAARSLPHGSTRTTAEW
jgi:hypothetical protein